MLPSLLQRAVSVVHAKRETVSKEAANVASALPDRCAAVARTAMRSAAGQEAESPRWTRDSRFPSCNSHIPSNRNVFATALARHESEERRVGSRSRTASRTAHEERELPFVESKVRVGWFDRLG